MKRIVLKFFYFGGGGISFKKDEVFLKFFYEGRVGI